MLFSLLLFVSIIRGKVEGRKMIGGNGGRGKGMMCGAGRNVKGASMSVGPPLSLSPLAHPPLGVH